MDVSRKFGLPAFAAVIGAGLIAGAMVLRPASVAPAAAPAVAEDAAAPETDVRLASSQAAFAMSHLGALRDEAELEPKAAPRAGDKPRPAQRAAAAPRPAAQVASAPLPPPAPQPAPASPESSPSPSIFGVSLPSPGKLVDRVASLGDSITSLVRWR